MTEYEKALQNDPTVKAMKKKLEDGTANSKDLDRLSAAAGVIAGECMVSRLKEEFPNGRISKDDVRRIISPIMKQNYGFVSEMAVLLQTAQYRKAGIGLKAVLPDYNTDREDELVAEISDRSFEDGFTW